MPNSEIDNNEFERLLEESLNTKINFRVGDKINGTLILVGKEVSFVSLPGQAEASIDTSELMDSDGNCNFTKDDSIEVYIASRKGSDIKVTLTIGAGEMSAELLRAAFENNMTIDGTVKSEVKGGFKVDISGVECFCPFSHIDLKTDSNTQIYMNNSFKFRIIEYKNRGKNIVISRKELLLEIQGEKEAILKEKLSIGDITTGTVSSKHNFGMFLNIGGMEALVPKSEISWSRMSSADKFNMGDEVQCKIIDMDWGKKKVTLSIKQLSPEPWSKIDSYELNSSINGKVSNIIVSGAFIEIEPGLEGFLHISRMSLTKNIKQPQDILTKGETVNVKIISIDKDDKKIGLELITDEENPWLSLTKTFASEVHMGIVENTRNNGITVRLSNGLPGYIPGGELIQSGDFQNDYSTGSEIKVAVKDFNASDRKLILSEKLAIKNEELLEYNKFVEKNNTGSTGSSLGSLFKDKFDKINEIVK